MKITWNENPLKTTVELDEHDREVLWLKIKVEELQERLFDVHFVLTERQHFNLDSARYYADSEYYTPEDNEKTRLDKRVDAMLECYTKELLGEHCGDCTCVPCSCLKCHAEGILGVNTLAPYPGKHVIANIGGAFREGTGIREALEYLKTHEISREMPENWGKGLYSPEYYQQCVIRWEGEQVQAYEWLKRYAKERFGIDG